MIQAQISIQTGSDETFRREVVFVRCMYISCTHLYIQTENTQRVVKILYEAIVVRIIAQKWLFALVAVLFCVLRQILCSLVFTESKYMSTTSSLPGGT